MSIGAFLCGVGSMKIYEGTYIGPKGQLRGSKGLVAVDPATPNWVLIQTSEGIMSEGWHRFPTDQWAKGKMVNGQTLMAAGLRSLMVRGFDGSEVALDCLRRGGGP